MRILVANDDGIDAPGIELLVSKLLRYGDITVVAPDRPRSASSHSILFSDIDIAAVDYPYDVKAYKISGTPADCVRIARSLFGEFDLVFSGVNNGLNLGTDIIYSGTVAVAREAYILGMPAVAISVDVDDFATASKDLDNLLEFVIMNNLYSSGYVLNINYPVNGRKNNGYTFAKMGKKRFKTDFVQENGVVKSTGEEITYDTDIETDVYLADKGFVTFVPIIIDMTNYEALESLKNA